ncbi:uncharacterized protein LOC124151013 isoform X1 [Haliotis rufescens]|uniref:uncharacterized protein LOC124151013 isoform X1 n=1 Tax=Haliotis rufescens TaxID=6454 RepID=UPI00201EB855|nr:uncharacterized protein LOC124151013 isoform X1 [Haliotis rufescens]
MAPVSIKFVVSFSSQDDHHKVQNLVGGDGFKKWLSHPKEKSGQIQAIFQLEEPSQFAYIDIGSQWCGSIEIKVGNSDWPQNRLYRTLVPTSSLMTPVECKMGQGSVKTRMFSAENFAPEVAAQKWDRIQVICRQPYRKDVQYGLSFVRIRAVGSKIRPSEGNEGGHCLELQDKTNSVASIQKHFFGSSLNKHSASPDAVKSRLMKLAGSSDGGVELDGALSRTAKLVLAASENAGKYSPQVRAGPGKSAKISLFSEHLMQKYGSTFEEELCEFLSSIQMENIDLDKVTIADLRHKFEKKKKRKLSQDEKKIFMQQCGDHICSLFDAAETKNNPTELSPLASSSRSQEVADSHSFSPKSYKKSTEKTHTTPSGCKRKLENENEFSRTPKSLRTQGYKSNLSTPISSKSTLLPQTSLISQIQKTFQQEDDLGNDYSRKRFPFASKAVNMGAVAVDTHGTPKTRKRSRNVKELEVDRADTCDQWLSKGKGMVSANDRLVGTTSTQAGSNPGTPKPSGSTRTKTPRQSATFGTVGSRKINEENMSRRSNQGSGYGGYVSCPSCRGNVPEHIFPQHSRTCNVGQELSAAASSSSSRVTQPDEDDVYTVEDDSADSDVISTHDAESFVECPLCGDLFPSDVITVHADVCATAMEFS